MTTLIKSMVLSLGLLTGVAMAAQAQSDSVAALPPGSAAAPAAVAPVGPSAAYPGPNVGNGWYASEKQTQAVAPSPAYVGPGPGQGWYAQEKSSGPTNPSPNYTGPRPN
jgi:hypothetical protein